MAYKFPRVFFCFTFYKKGDDKVKWRRNFNDLECAKEARERVLKDTSFHKVSAIFTDDLSKAEDEYFGDIK